MTTRPETERLLDDLEAFAKRKFRYRTELGLLIDIAESRQEQALLEEVVFLSKFVVKAYEVLRREGRSSNDTQKLSGEFDANVKKISERIQSLIKNSSEETRTAFTERFLSLTHQGLNNFLALVMDLSWLKNYSIDKGRLK